MNDHADLEAVMGPSRETCSGQRVYRPRERETDAALPRCPTPAAIGRSKKTRKMSLLEPYREFGEVWRHHQMSQKSPGGHWPVFGEQSVRTLSLMLSINRERV